MDIQVFIRSGILEEYCLGMLDEGDETFVFQMALLYPEIKEELNSVELVIEELAILNALEPDQHVRQKLLTTLGFKEDEFDINNLPVVDHDSDPILWWKAIGHLIPTDTSIDFFALELRNDEYCQQTLVITKNDVDEEEHSDFLESFFILEGNCECTVGNECRQLGPGDFLEIPLQAKHNIKITSPRAVAILQYRFL